jgi:hypothetical protein
MQVAMEHRLPAQSLHNYVQLPIIGVAWAGIVLVLWFDSV